MEKKREQDCRDAMSDAGDFESAALSSAQWLASLKLAAADWSIAAADVACLLERDVIAKSGRTRGLDHQGRVVLGLSV